MNETVHKSNQTNRLAKVSLTFGILSGLIVPAILATLLNAPIVMYISMISFGVVAFVTGLRALSQIKATSSLSEKSLSCPESRVLAVFKGIFTPKQPLFRQKDRGSGLLRQPASD